MDSSFWNNRSVLVTGHTGFKGSWLSLMLSILGAKVHGFSLEPNTTNNMFNLSSVDRVLETSTIGDIRNLEQIKKAIFFSKPSIIFHLAAQPIVRYSYIDPVETFAVNVIGTANLLDASSSCATVKAIVNVTTDKCYQNNEWCWPYREIDALGGKDPYSASKACSELVSICFKHSFLKRKGIALATARAGNVIGGGDWSQDRLIPDIIRSIENNNVFVMRNPNAVRPWQHVFEALEGYRLLAEKLISLGDMYSEAWNFGPREEANQPVSTIVDIMSKTFPEFKFKTELDDEFHEARLLQLDSNKARSRLGWKSKWQLEAALENTIGWYKAWMSGVDMHEFSNAQINDYLKI